MKVLLWVLVVLLLLALVAGGVGYYLYKNFERPQILSTYTDVGDAKTKDGESLLYMKVYNPNGYGFKVSGVRYYMSLQGDTVLSGSTNDTLNLLASDTSDLQIPYKYDSRKYQKLIGKADSSEYLFSFSGHVPMLSWLKDTFSYSTKIKLPNFKEPKPEVGKLKFIGFEKGIVSVEVPVTFYNDNTYPLSVSGLEYTVEVDDVQWAEGDFQKALNVPAKGTEHIVVPVEVDISSLKKSAFDYLKGNKKQYYVLSVQGNYNAPYLKTPIFFQVRQDDLLKLDELKKML